MKCKSVVRNLGMQLADGKETMNISDFLKKDHITERIFST